MATRACERDWREAITYKSILNRTSSKFHFFVTILLTILPYFNKVIDQCPCFAQYFEKLSVLSVLACGVHMVETWMKSQGSGVRRNVRTLWPMWDGMVSDMMYSQESLNNILHAVSKIKDISIQIKERGKSSLEAICKEKPMIGIRGSLRSY